jgi:hypothetical protein
MFCPNPECSDFKETGSHGEYVEGVVVCPYCGSSLVEYLPADTVEADKEEARREGEPATGDDTEEDFVEVASHNGRPDADVMASFLQSQGIDAFVVTDDCGGTYSAVGFGTGSRVMVPKRQAEEAIALIDTAEEHAADGDPTEA